MADTRRRVKLYALNADRQWDDRGTGHVSSSYVERLKGMSLLVRAESDGSLLLESRIQPDTAYQKQQETLIVWSEGDNFDLALSFQEKAGCDEIWERICQVQGKDPSVDITQDIVEESEDERFEDMSDTAPPIELPPCEVARLEEISELITSCLPSTARREKLAIALESEGYIKKLLDVFRMCEDLENREGLGYLYDIFKNIFLLNKNSLFDIMFAHDVIFDVVGVLEYEPNVPIAARKRHREYLKNISHFKEVIPLSNPDLVAKIHQTYRVQYIQDVVLPTPSVYEENMLSTLSSFIFFNKVEIVQAIQEDQKFLSEVFFLLGDDSTEDDKRRDLVLFLKEFCMFSQTLQQQNREAFFKTLSSLGVLQALEITLGMDDPTIKTASIDILSYIVDFSPSMVREYALSQVGNQDDNQLIINIIIEQMVCDPDPELGGAVQLSGVLRLMLDPDNMISSVSKSEKNEFLNFFYKHCMHVLIAPVFANTCENKPCKEDLQTAQLLGLILELLTFCVEHHTYHIKNYIYNKDLLRRILILMKSKHTFVVLSALRFMRKMVGLKDEFYNRYIVNGNLFEYIIEAFKANNGTYNLLDSAIIEMFEFIKVEDIKPLCTHVVEKFGKVLDKVDYVQTFRSLRLRYEQHLDRQRERPTTESVASLLRNNSRFRRDPRQMDEDEEMWFNDEDEDGDVAVDVLGKKLEDEFEHFEKILDKRQQVQPENKDYVKTVRLLNKRSPPQANTAPQSPGLTRKELPVRSAEEAGPIIYLPRLDCCPLREADASIRVRDVYTNTFPLLNGVRQGCRLSVVLFSIGVERLLRRLESVLGRGSVVVYADDIVLFIRDDAQFELVPLILEEFRMSSGVAVNFSKICGLWCGSWKHRTNYPLSPTRPSH
ncbi:SMEK2 [Cordylochernes scorpioides]|uniref:SMEK2 n=1 Tax=Cordylochernes scorpioides TaxID=51811 RepID=A0ABY6LQV3_9ARAC|nr:SMEK2 [Cordylochernes scorpioides]